MSFFKYFGQKTDLNLQEEFRRLGGRVSLQDLKKILKPPSRRYVQQIPASELRKVWDYRSAGLSIEEARTWLSEHISKIMGWHKSLQRLTSKPTQETSKWIKIAKRIRQRQDLLVRFITDFLLAKPVSMSGPYQGKSILQASPDWARIGFFDFLKWTYNGQMYITVPLRIKKGSYITYRWPTEAEWAEMLSSRFLMSSEAGLIFPSTDNWRFLLDRLAAHGRIQFIQHSAAHGPAWRAQILKKLPPLPQVPDQEFRRIVVPFIARKKMLGE